MTLTSQDSITKQVVALGVKDWNSLINYVQQLPYGRNTNRHDLSLVLSEQQGTCSSKHALLKHMADLNLIPNVKLILGIYNMTQKNTPKIGHVLAKYGLNSIPEAHCYLQISGVRKDVTLPSSDFNKIADDLLEETFIQPNQVNTYKVTYHKNFLKTWIKDKNDSQQFDDLWKIREACIQALGSY